MTKPKASNRRDFLQQSGRRAAALAFAAPMVYAAHASETTSQPAALGGTPVCTSPLPSWPQIEQNDQDAWRRVLEAKGWCRLDGEFVLTFEKRFAEATGAKECLATANGTSALFCSLNGLGIGPGDEVLVPPYTFVATINVVLLQHALPVFVDTDRETFQIDAKKIEARITPRTRAIIPVHLGGNPADMDTILAVAKKHNLRVIEDACQAHFAEWNHHKVGTLGDTGCFSFQVSKNLCSGEGGAILTHSDEIMEECFTFHCNGRSWKNARGFGYQRNGANLRMTEFQGALLLEQMTRVEGQMKVREQNAEYLTRQLEEIEGIHPAKMYAGTTRNAYHLYMFRYDALAFAGLPRDKFIKALQAEGVFCGSGYSPLNLHPFLENSLRKPGYEKLFGKETMDRYFQENQCPENDKLCNEAVWFVQNTMLYERGVMDQIAEAVRKIQKNADQLAKA